MAHERITDYLFLLLAITLTEGEDGRPTFSGEQSITRVQPSLMYHFPAGDTDKVFKKERHDKAFLCLSDNLNAQNILFGYFNLKL